MLALDLGEARIGVAVSDELGLVARPLGVVASRGPKRDAQAIRGLADDLAPVLVVVGLPLLASGEEGASATRARERGADLARRLELPVDFVDESGTTLEAQASLLRSGARRRRRRETVDAVAAALILESWLAGRASA